MTPSADHTIERDELTRVRLHDPEEPWPIARGVLSREITNERAVDAHLDRVGVKSVGWVRHENGVNVEPHVVCSPPADDSPKLLLPVRPPNHLQRLIASQQHR